MAKNLLILGGLFVVLGVAPLAHAEPVSAAVCGQTYGAAAKLGSDLKAISLLLDKAGDCCAADMNADTAQTLVQGIKTVVNNTTLAAAKGADANEAGKILSQALGCAGQPAIVAVDPTLYSTVLADSSEFAELARDEVDDKDLIPLQPARIGALPNNNQQPTVSVEQK